MRLSLLICTLPERRHYLRRLHALLDPQLVNQPVEVKHDPRPKGVLIGAKRNALLRQASGDYVAFIDDDDRVSADYVDKVLRALSSNPDCSSLVGTITFDGKNPRQFIHTIDCQTWHERDGVYYRSPNHLNAIRRDLALQAGFPENNFGEDHEFSKRVQPLLKTEAPIDGTIYFYDYRARK